RIGGTIKQVMDFVFEKKLLSKPEKMKKFEDRIFSSIELETLFGDLDEVEKDKQKERLKKDKAFHDQLMAISYKEVLQLREYLDEHTPFSTKHGVKGEEYVNVLVVIDDTAWNQYNFDCVFANDQTKKQYERTKNLLYGCCSRAKCNLAIYSVSDLSPISIKTIEKWFGVANVINVASLP
ncbi:MAG: hypothetical protein IID51_09110, partial [Proteobacteria bacterium]|nr:hypothetical protein [Pseudomonadota bacterium]